MSDRMQIGTCKVGDLVAWGSGIGVIVREIDYGRKLIDGRPIYSAQTYWVHPPQFDYVSGIDTSYLSHLSVEVLAR